MESLLRFTDRGIYCEAADVYLDPWKPVQRALITHGHSDHARWGHQSYLCTDLSLPIIQHRLGNIQIESVPYGRPVTINGVTFSFHPAGHIPGSAQIRVSYKGEVWVFSGDYKVAYDGLSTPFEPVKCHTFITESTFGLPIFQFPEHGTVHTEIMNWWRRNAALGKCSVIFAYVLGKAQRILHHLQEGPGPVYVHGGVYAMNEVLRNHGWPIQEFAKSPETKDKKALEGALIIAPPSAEGSPWIRKFMPYASAMASGWMHVRGMRRRRAMDTGFVLSDHADWPQLNAAIKATEAERVFVTHGYTDVFAAWLQSNGLEAHAAKTAYEGEPTQDEPTVEGGETP